MGSAACSILGGAVLAVLLAGYLAQRYLPPPKPKFVGIDLGTTYSCVGVYHAVQGNVDVLKNRDGHRCIPSIVAFSDDGIVVGYKAEAQADQNPENTFYDAKRFIGKKFTKDDLQAEAARYPFKLVADEFGMVRYVVQSSNNISLVTPEHIGSRVLSELRDTAERNLSAPVTKAVMSVPAEFTEMQRNYTKMAAKLAGIDVLRIINEPTAAALAYGLHKKANVQFVMVVDLGGGTLDVSLLHIQGGMFLTQAMAGNNHLGGQDFNQRLMNYILKEIEMKYNKPLTDPEDVQHVRQAAENIKLQLTKDQSATLTLYLKSVIQNSGKPAKFTHTVTRKMFEDLNYDLFKKVLEPVEIVLQEADLPKDYIDEIVLVGGSTRIPKVRELITQYFGKLPNTSIDPELAVASGVSIQAGILGGMWPLTVSATELPSSVRKIHVL